MSLNNIHFLKIKILNLLISKLSLFNLKTQLEKGGREEHIFEFKRKEYHWYFILKEISLLTKAWKSNETIFFELRKDSLISVPFTSLDKKKKVILINQTD